MFLNFKKCDEMEIVRFRNMKFNLTAKESNQKIIIIIISKPISKVILKFKKIDQH
jgi:hypothetical protein